MSRKKSNYDATNRNILYDFLKWKIAIYIRLSKEDDKESDKENDGDEKRYYFDDESLSVTNQRKIIIEYIDSHFENENFEIVDFYIDDGTIGTDSDRENFQRMLKDIEQEKVNCVICKDLSRAFRNYAEQGHYLEEFFPKHKVRFITVGYPKVDSYLDPEGVTNFEIPINGIMNDRYAAKTSRDVRTTFATKIRKGEFIGNYAPYGLKKSPENKNQLIVDEESAKVVRLIFDLFVKQGMSVRGIARELNDRNIPNPSTYKKSVDSKYNHPKLGENTISLWNPSVVRKFLTNQMYIGNMVQGITKVVNYKVHDRILVPKEKWVIVENTHEAIIDKDTFWKAQELFKRNVRTTKGERIANIFAGFLKCGDCKLTMTRTKNSSGTIYYHCRRYKEQSNTMCTVHTIRLDVLEKVVLSIIHSKIQSIANTSELLEIINKNPNTNNESKFLLKSIESKQQELIKLHNMSDSLFISLQTNVIDKEQYFRLKAKFSEQINNLKKEIEKLQIKHQKISVRIDSNYPYLQNFLKYKNNKELNRNMLIDLVDNIYVLENNLVQVKFKNEDEYERIIEYIKNNTLNEHL